MPQKSAIVRTAGSAVRTSREVSEIRTGLNQQRRFRTEQLEELTAGAADADEVARVLGIGVEAALDDIDAALVRLEGGSYGMCERCAEPISWERLEVLPTARFCTSCQHTIESARSRSARQTQARVAVAGRR
jgi:RNA polymerase-binding transcription factor DksA